MDVFVRKIRVDRIREPREMIKATGFELIGNNAALEEVLASMPRGKDDEVRVRRYRLPERILERERLQHCIFRGLFPLDPYSLGAAVAANPRVVRRKRACSAHWKDNDGNPCYLLFQVTAEGRRVAFVDRCLPNQEWNEGHGLAVTCERPFRSLLVRTLMRFS